MAAKRGAPSPIYLVCLGCCEAYALRATPFADFLSKRLANPAWRNLPPAFFGVLLASLLLGRTAWHPGTGSISQPRA